MSSTDGGIFFRQIKYRGDNFSYLMAKALGKAVVVDPAFNADYISKLAQENQLEIAYIIDTHSHMDHIAGNADLKKRHGAKIVAHRLAKIDKDAEVVDGDLLEVDGLTLKIIHTPGHTKDGICILVDGKLLTGDTLFVGECGRTDLPGSDVKEMYDSLFSKLMKLDDGIEVYPGHDYGSRPSSTIGIERQTNWILEKRTLEEFIVFMRSP